MSDLATIDQTEVSRNNGFLLGVGVVAGGKKKSLTSKGRALAHALDYDLPSEIEKSWKALVEESDFLRKVLAAIRVRGGMDLASIKGHIAFMAGQPNRGRALIGAGSVLEVLTAAGAIAEDDGKIVATRLDEVVLSKPEEVRQPPSSSTTTSGPVKVFGSPTESVGEEAMIWRRGRSVEQGRPR